MRKCKQKTKPKLPNNQIQRMRNVPTSFTRYAEEDRKQYTFEFIYMIGHVDSIQNKQ